jgi:hypothetical protein
MRYTREQNLKYQLFWCFADFRIYGADYYSQQRGGVYCFLRIVKVVLEEGILVIVKKGLILQIN